MEGFGRKTESKRKNKEDYEKKCPKESGEEGDHIKDYREKRNERFKAPLKARSVTVHFPVLSG